MRYRFLIAILGLLVATASAQVSPHPFRGSITTAGADCSTATSCVVVTLPTGTASATIAIDDDTGSFSGTQQFEGSVDGSAWIAMKPTSNSTNTNSSTTATGSWQFNPSSYIKIRVRASARASGTAAITINWGPAVASSGGGSSSGTVTNAASLTLNHVMLGAGSNAAAVDSALVTDGAGAISGATSITASGTINGASVSAGTAPTACGSATGCFAGTEASTAGTPTAGQSYFRFSSTAHNLGMSFNNGAESFFSVAAGKTAAISNTLTLAGTDGTTMTFPTTSATVARTDAANTFTGHQTIEGVTSTGATGTGKFVFDTAPTLGAVTATSLTLNGTTAGFFDFPQGTTSAAVAPCNTATSICYQAPTSVTSQLRTLAGAPATGFEFWTNTAGSMVETLIGTTGSGNVALATSPVFTTPNVGTATTTAIVGAANTAVTVQGGVDATTTGASGTLLIKGEEVTGGSTASLAGGAVTIRGGNNASTGASGTAGALTLTAGGMNGASTNLAGADATLAAGLGTGNAAVSHVKIQSPALGLATGTAAESQITRYVTHVKAGSTTSATPTTLFNIASASNTAWGVMILVHVDLISSTPNVCGTTEHFSLTGTNNNGSFGTVNITAGTISTLCSAGTLTLAVTATAANPSVISVTPTWGTITSITSATITVQIFNVSQQEIALL